MTAVPLAAAPARSTPRGAPLRRPSLELVPQTGGRTGRARRTPFAAVVVSLLAVGLLGLLVLNTVLAQDAFRLHTLKAESRALEDREQLLQREVEALRAPQALAARAGALGMVQAGRPRSCGCPTVRFWAPRPPPRCRRRPRPPPPAGGPRSPPTSPSRRARTSRR
jgi:cell division protein FtsB